MINECKSVSRLSNYALIACIMHVLTQLRIHYYTTLNKGFIHRMQAAQVQQGNDGSADYCKWLKAQKTRIDYKQRENRKLFTRDGNTIQEIIVFFLRPTEE